MYRIAQLFVLISIGASVHAFASPRSRASAPPRKDIPGLDPGDAEDIPELMAISKKQRHDHHNRDVSHRDLSNDGNGYESHFVDEKGNEYDPYSLAWRYLGMYLDCDPDDYENDNNDVERRRLSGDDNNSCEPKLLWAAYHDPHYRGGTIGEYQFYDLSTSSWDSSTCTSRRCAKMNCHEPHTHFKLVGVFKETDGLYDFAEQLLKHEGYCIWNDDEAYEDMEEWMERWPTECTQLNYPDDDGNTLYMHTQPLPEGNMTLGIFEDEMCTVNSATVDLSGYIISAYYAYYGDEEKGLEVAETYENAVLAWNEKMSTFKVCQPCVAYNLGNSNYNRKKKRNRRRLGDDENDGEGEERGYYDCYDDAGYTNVNQCYKFETKTDMEVAEKQDLALASKQGTILRIRAFGRTYGSGGYSTPINKTKVILSIAILYVGCVIGFIIFDKKIKRSRQINKMPQPLKETLQSEDIEENGNDDPSAGSGAHVDKDDGNKSAATMSKACLAAESEIDTISIDQAEKGKGDKICVCAAAGTDEGKGEYMAPTPPSTTPPEADAVSDGYSTNHKEVIYAKSLQATFAEVIDDKVQSVESIEQDVMKDQQNKNHAKVMHGAQSVESIEEIACTALTPTSAIASEAIVVKAGTSATNNTTQAPVEVVHEVQPATRLEPEIHKNVEAVDDKVHKVESAVQDAPSFQPEQTNNYDSHSSNISPVALPPAYSDNERDLTQYGLEAKMSPSGKYTIVQNKGARYKQWLNHRQQKMKK